MTYIPNYSARPMEWSNWPYWTVGLVARGFSDEEIRKKILGGKMPCAFWKGSWTRNPGETMGPDNPTAPETHMLFLLSAVE